jgi:hypothetical protein
MATQSIQLKPRGANLFSTGQPALYLENGTTIPYSGYGFDASTSEQMFLDFKVPFYLSGNLTVTLRWYSQTGQTTGAVVWGAQIAALTAGDAQSVLTDALATAQTTTTTVVGTARAPTETIITVTNLDSLAADDTVQMRIYRDAAVGGDTMTGDAIIFDIEVEYAATGGTGAGNVSNAGASTDNAIVRFDLATGQVIQNSGVIIDDSNNITGVAQLTATKFVGPGADIIQALTADTASITTITTVMTFALPSAGTYDIDISLIFRLATAASAQNTSVRLAYSGTTTRAAYSATCETNSTNTVGMQATTTINTDLTFSVQAAATTTDMALLVRGSITVSTSGNLTVQVTRATNAVVVKAGSSGGAIPQ